MIVFTRKNIFSLLMAVFLFIIINMPSIKLIYSSTIVNIVGLSGLWGTGLVRENMNKFFRVRYTQTYLTYIFNFLWLWLSLLWVTWLINPSSFGVRNLFQYVSVILITIGISLFVKKNDLKKLFWIQIFWGSLVSYLEITVGIDKNLDLGQNYLTSGVAIALTVVMLIGYIFSRENLVKIKVLLIPVLLLLLNGLTSLSGRAPILLAIAVPTLIFLLSVIFSEDKVKKVILLLLFPLITIIVISVLIQKLPGSTVDRILRIFVSIKEEPRYELYNRSINIILKRPFGIGLTGQQQYGMMYPHNLFLEVMMAGGIIAIIPLVTFLFILAKKIFKTMKNKDNSIIWLSALLYLFLTWNISFDLSSSYMLFSLVSIYYVSTYKSLCEYSVYLKPYTSTKYKVVS